MSNSFNATLALFCEIAKSSSAIAASSAFLRYSVFSFYQFQCVFKFPFRIPFCKHETSKAMFREVGIKEEGPASVCFLFQEK